MIAECLIYTLIRSNRALLIVLVLQNATEASISELLLFNCEIMR